MRHYRLGNDLMLRVALFDVSAEGLRQPHSLTGEVSMIATTKLDSVKLTVSSVVDNIITATFTGAEMRAEGVYTLTVVEKLGEHSRTIDICQAFELVGCACEASGEVVSNDTTLDIESVVAMLPYAIDADLDPQSTNAVQNRAVTQAIDALAKEMNGYVFLATMDSDTLALSFEGFEQENNATCDKLWSLYSSNPQEFDRVPIVIQAVNNTDGNNGIIPVHTRAVGRGNYMSFTASLFKVNTHRFTFLICLQTEDGTWVLNSLFSSTNEYPSLVEEKIQDINLRTPLYSLVCTLENGINLILDPAFPAINNETLAMMHLMQDNPSAQPRGNVELIVNTTGSNDRYRGFLSYHTRGRIWVGNITNYTYFMENYVETISGFSFAINVRRNGDTYTIDSFVRSLRLLGEEYANQNYISTIPRTTYSLAAQSNARSNMGINQIVLQTSGTIDKVTIAATDATGYENSNRVAYKRMANAYKVNTNELFIVTLFIDDSFTVSGLVRAANLETWNGLLLDSVYTPSSNFGAAIRLYNISVDGLAVEDAVMSGDYSGIRWKYAEIRLPEYGGLLNEINKIKAQLKELTTK